MIGSVPIALVLLALALHDTADLDDRALARRIREGDRTAFRVFFDRHHGALYRFLRSRGVPPPVCEDLVQQAYLAVWERRDRIDENKSLRAFLFTAGYNRALNHFRDTARFTPGDPPDTPDPGTDPQEHVAFGMMQEALGRAVATLPERRRAVFELCFVQELTYREAAEVLGISVKTVENQMGHALKAIRKALTPFL